MRNGTAMLGRRIRKMRRAVDMSQLELAGYLGVDESTVCRYERGVRVPDFVMLVRLSEYLGVSVDWLCLGDLATSESNFPERQGGDASLV